MYYRDSHGVAICFDITTQDTFDACSFWVKDLEKNAPEKAIKFLCGLKSDLADQRQVDQYKAQAFAKQHNMEYIEVSSKTGDNVESTFQRLAQAIFNQQKKPVKRPDPV